MSERVHTTVHEFNPGRNACADCGCTKDCAYHKVAATTDEPGLRTLKEHIARLAVGDPDYPLHVVLAEVDALAASDGSLDVERLRAIEQAARRVSDAAIAIEAVRYAYGAPKNGSALFLALGELDAVLGKPLRPAPDTETP